MVDMAAGTVVVDVCVLAGPGLVNVFAATEHICRWITPWLNVNKSMLMSAR